MVLMKVARSSHQSIRGGSSAVVKGAPSPAGWAMIHRAGVLNHNYPFRISGVPSIISDLCGVLSFREITIGSPVSQTD